MYNSLLLSQALSQVGSAFESISTNHWGPREGSGTPSSPRSKREATPLDEHGGGNSGNLGLQWEDDLEDKS